MMPFLRISDKVSGMIPRVIQGQSYSDDDTFEVANFEIEQWRRNAVGQYNCGLLGVDWPSFPVPSWARLLYLRANSVKGMLLRPFFFSNSCPSGNRSIKPALELISNTIKTLVTLDNSSDIYRKQHPHYQHILAGSCALLFLVVAYVEQNQKILSPSLSAEFANSVKHSYSDALTLAGAYGGSLRSSRGLLRRLVLMKQPLITLGILPANNNLPSISRLDNSQQPATQTPPMRALAETNNRASAGNSSALPSSAADAGTNRASNVYDDRFATSLPSYPSNTLMLGWPMNSEHIANINWNESSLLGQWAFAGEEDFFSYASI